MVFPCYVLKGIEWSLRAVSFFSQEVNNVESSSERPPKFCKRLEVRDHSILQRGKASSVFGEFSYEERTESSVTPYLCV